MKNYQSLYMAFIGILACILCTACEPDRGDRLDGKWLLEEITFADGSVHPVDTVWYNFQNTLFMYQLYQPVGDHDLHIYGFKSWETDDRILLEMKPSPVSVESFLPLTDWEEPTRSFDIKSYSRQRLILTSEGKEYSFRKF